MARRLKPLPSSATRLAQFVDSPDCDLEAVLGVIRLDPVLTMKLLQAANSAAAAGGMAVSTVDEAVIRMGTGLVASLVMAISVGPVMRQALPGYGLSAGLFWRHSVLSAIAAERLAAMAGGHLPPEIVTAALLHDIGKLVLAQHATAEQFALIRRCREETGAPPYLAEKEVLKLHHGEVGGIVAQQWSLPDRICSAIQHHHEPEQWDDPIGAGVLLANQAAKAMESVFDQSPQPAGPPPEILARLELIDFDFTRFCTRCQERFLELQSCYGV